ncbi:unnamed protein product [Candidula unifasciata]|uniref:Uncharacterized protein n=1 Tax=Candidula unifasciata TaxID=100452 RepID=A0A8S3YL75_9EUPU|nr:unnamed protein product [Candidula unifasciata]
MAGIMFEKETTKISQAIFNKDIVGLRAALKEKEDPHHKDRKGNTYLHYICTMHRPIIIHIILGTGIDVNARNRHGNTALHVTALHHECCHVGDLLSAGIDPTIRNNDGKTAAELHTRNKFWKSIYDKYQPGIFEAVASHDIDKVLYLLHCWSRVDSCRNGQTLRQFAASHKFHDIVFHLDVHKYTLGAIYSVLEGDQEKAWSHMSNARCDINFLNYAADSSHILQFAINRQDSKIVNMICKSRVNVNVRVTVQGFLKAPLFFAAIDPKISNNILWAVLQASVDFSLRDERGRNAAVYALDRTRGKIPVEVIVHMLKHGLDVSQRDGTGVTLRDVARLARRKDIVDVIDQILVRMVRKSDLAELERLAVMGYDSIIIDYNYRDTYIYASGNESDDVLQFIQQLQQFHHQVQMFHSAICHSSLDDVTLTLATADRPDLLLNARDKGGRTGLHLCILHRRADVLKLLLSHQNLDITAVDNLGRTAYHYSCAVEESNERHMFVHLLEAAGIDTEALDYRNHKASSNCNNSTAAQWLDKERKMHFGMGRQLTCVDKYEQLCHLMTQKRKQLKHFEKAICKFPYPVSGFSHTLSPVLSDYRDLVFVAMDNGKEDIAVRLIQLGVDWRRKEFILPYPDSADEGSSTLMSVAEYAGHLGLQKLIMAIKMKTDYQQSQLISRKNKKK